uniref:ATP synthase F0 subunit 8 n=1 Tax=Cycloneda sanguinea TaxID=633097 RepID=A0A173GHP7_9CUCU|nr:ATP synthase F0 subunit 8 [Cycloneda sanguinea]ARI43918.1 ATP synthase F0 subunit 8 [Cycloneda sanguinea]
MPQAMPLNWLELYMMFTLVFLLIMVKMYFFHQKLPLNFKKKMNNKKNNWKW